MYKVITISGDDDPTGRLFARVVSSDTPLEKTASAELHPDIQKFISGVKPTSGKVYILVNALGAGEYYGSNLNGDFFEEAELNPTDPKADWGYKTFLKAGCYRNHSNKDPGKTLGKVVVAVYNSKMHRVELIIEFDEKLCEQQGHGDLFTKLKNGEKPSVSMGARVAFDKCCVCGHVSRTTQDHCFPAGTGVITDLGEPVPIETIGVGDRILAADGTVTTVEEVFSRNIDECVLEITHTGNGVPVVATKNHPFLSSKREQYSCYYRTTSPGARSCFPGVYVECDTCQRAEPVPNFVRADELRPGDTLYLPEIRGTAREGLTRDDAYIIGLFVAEGSFGRQYGKLYSAQFSIHQDETDLLAKIDAYAARWGKTARVYQPKNSKGLSVRINDERAAAFFYKYCGAGAHTKIASQEIVNAPNDVLRAYLQGLWDGDGYVHKNKTSSAKLNTASKRLAWQTAALLRRLGHGSFVGTYKTPGGPGQREKKTTMWYVQTDFLTQLPRAQSPIVSGRQLAQVRTVTETHFAGTVYNLRTSAHTYVVDGVAVHNCDHFKTQAGQIMPDGKKVFVYNPKPRFFDISVVVIGADRISHVMHKIASLNGSQNIIGDTAHDRLAALVKRAAQSKRAEIKKEIPATSAQVVGRIASKEDDLPNSLLDRLGKHHDLGAALSAVTSAGMVLKPREFQRIIIIKIGQHPLADQLDSLGGIFPPSSLLDDSIDMPCCPTVSGPGGIGYLLKALLPSIGERSCFNQPLSGRVTIIKTASAVQPRQYVDTPLLRKISAAYNSYRDQVVEKIASIVGNVTARDIDLLSAVRSRMLEDAFLSRSSITKSASVTDTSALLSPASLAYLYSAHRDTGEQTKTAAALLRNHPLVALSMQRGVNKLDVPTFTTK